MNPEHEDGHGAGVGANGTSSNNNNNTRINDDASNHQLLSQLEDSFRQEQSQTHGNSNPLLTRLNQNSAERAHVAAVGNQLGSEGTRVPAVIGDFVGLGQTAWNGQTSFATRNTNSNLHDALDNMRLGGEDEEANELDADYEEGDEDDISNFNQETGQQPQAGSGGLSETMREAALSAASAVDPQQLLETTTEGSSLPWNVMGGFETGMQDDDDELDENDPAMEELGLALTPKSKREKKKSHKRGVIVLSPEVQNLLGAANNAYVIKDYKLAVDLFQQVIVKNPSVFQAWNNMGLIQEELGNIEKALQLFMVAAHLTPKDGALWKKLAVISKERGYDQQALYCFSRAYRADKDDMDALWDRSVMYQILDQPYKAIQGFQKLLKVKHHYMPALEELVKLYSSLDQDNKRYRENMHQALLDYEAAYLHYSSLPDRFSGANTDPFDVTEQSEDEAAQNEPFGYSALNMLSELYIMFEEYEKPIKMIKAWSRRLQRRSHQTWWDDYKDDREFDTDADDEEMQATLGENRTRGLPVDLRVKLGVCRLMMEEVKEAKAQFKYLWRCSVEDFPDLYEEIAELYVAKQMWKEAHNVLRAMMQFDEMDIPKIWVMVGECLRHMGHMKEAKDYLEQAHRDDPSNVDVSMMLAEVHEEMGNLPQALSLVNYVRRVNAEKQAEAEKRRREAKAARDAKAGKDVTVPSKVSLAPVPAPQQYLMDPNYPKDYRFRQIAPRPGSNSSGAYTSEAAQSALERINAASRDRAAAEKYAMADRDRDIRLLRAAREQERADKLADRESHTQELRDVIDRFNKLDIIFQRIDAKEKSKVWENKVEAVKATREDRTQYIQGARELIEVFRNNGAFYPREKYKPYLGTETKKWRYRRYAADLDSGLSEHATAMSERLGRLMGVSQPRIVPEESPLDHGMTAPPTTYKEVSFDAWYLLMIRQAVYLTFEDRYAEASELLNKDMYNANVFYSVPRRRSGIMLVALACAMWASDYAEVINSGRRLCNFGGVRPFAVKLYQSVFTLGPRGHPKFFAWVQNITHKYMKREIDKMRRAVGKGRQQGMRKVKMGVRKRRHAPATRAPRKTFDLTPALASPRKKVRMEGTSASARSLSNLQQQQLTEPGSSPFVVSASSAQTTVGATILPQTSFDRAETVSARLLAAAAAQEAEMGAESVYRPRASFSNDDGGIRKDQEHETSRGAATDGIEGPSAMSLRKKRQIEDEGEGGQNEAFDDDDDYDVQDELYKEDEDEDKEMDPEEYDEIEWEQDDPDFPMPRGGKGYGTVGRGGRSNLSQMDEEEDEDEGVNGPQGRSRRSSATGKGAKRTSGISRAGLKYTKPSFPKFQIAMVMSMGHILAQSRSHVGAAAHFAECMEYAPTNPMIQLYLGVQIMNVAMQRTTVNRQMTMAQAMVFIQNYYRLRMGGFGSLALAEREKAGKAQGKPSLPVPIAPIIPIVGVKDEVMESRISAAAPATTGDRTTVDETSEDDQSPSTRLDSPVAESSTSQKARALGPETFGSRDESSTATTAPQSSLQNSPEVEEEQLPPVTQCQQEAEYNYARAFHQLGQYHLAIMHYKRVLELPSWREIEREQQQAARKQEAEGDEKSVKQRRRSEAIERRRMERQQQVREIREARRIKKEEEKAEVGGTEKTEDEVEMEGEEGLDLDMEEDVEDEDDDEEDDDDEGEEKERKSEGAQVLAAEEEPSRIRLQGKDDEDPTDLKREAAFNLAKIYTLSGAVGLAQMLMRKYCTF
ncbi:transcription factor TFIIIC subunit tfc4 [Mortierella sp. GBA30]|nr:transcription factor TFIIIC subunit tfc4 [Mortierella sp. GBA30]